MAGNINGTYVWNLIKRRCYAESIVLHQVLIFSYTSSMSNVYLIFAHVRVCVKSFINMWSAGVLAVHWECWDIEVNRVEILTFCDVWTFDFGTFKFPLRRYVLEVPFDLILQKKKTLFGQRDANALELCEFDVTIFDGSWILAFYFVRLSLILLLWERHTFLNTTFGPEIIIKFKTWETFYASTF